MALESFYNEAIIKRIIRNKEVFEYRYPQLFIQQEWNKYVDEEDRKMYTMREEKLPGMVT